MVDKVKVPARGLQGSKSAGESARDMAESARPCKESRRGNKEKLASAVHLGHGRDPCLSARGERREE